MRIPSSGNATTTLHIFANGMLIATIEGNGSATSTKYIHPDHLGGTNVVTDSTGTAEQTLDYEPFGATRIDSKTSSFTEQRKFIGEEVDTDTALSYLNARYYDGSRGQFLSEDPAFLGLGVDGRTGKILHDPQLLNSYSYSRNNPLVIKDPEGDLGIFALFAIGALVNVSAQGLEDLIAGNPFQLENYIGAAVGGFAGTAALLSGYGSFGVGAVTSGTEELVTQGLKIASGEAKLSVSSVAAIGGAAVLGGGFGKVSGFAPSVIPATKPGSAVLKAFTDYKAVGGTIRSLTPQVGSKILTTQFLGGLPQPIATGVSKNSKSLDFLSSTLKALEAIAKDLEQKINNLKYQEDLTNANRA